MKTKILFLSICTAILFSSCSQAQLPLPPGSPLQVLQSNGGALYPTWATPGECLLDTITVNLNTTAYQGIKFAGTTTSQFIVTNILITYATGTPIAAKGGEWWTKKNHAGYNVAHTLKQVTSVFTYLTSDTAFLDKGVGGTITISPGGHPYLAIRDSLYFNVDTANSASLQVTMFLYGKKIN